jgi:hypothetical protein
MVQDNAIAKLTGRPPKLPSPDVAERIRALAVIGRSKVAIARELRINFRTLCKWLELDEALAEAFEVGRKTEEDEMVELLKTGARNGDKPNINAMFILKTRHGYREGETQNTTNRVNIVFNLQGPMTREEFMKTTVKG